MKAARELYEQARSAEQAYTRQLTKPAGHPSGIQGRQLTPQLVEEDYLSYNRTCAKLNIIGYNWVL